MVYTWCLGIESIPWKTTEAAVFCRIISLSHAINPQKLTLMFSKCKTKWFHSDSLAIRNTLFQDETSKRLHLKFLTGSLLEESIIWENQSFLSATFRDLFYYLINLDVLDKYSLGCFLFIWLLPSSGYKYFLEY